MKKKVLIYELTDGRKFKIDRHVVAHDRAKYYSEKEPETAYQEEYDYAMSEDGEECMWDWVDNNMDWWEHNPVLVETGSLPLPRYAEIDDKYTDEIEEEGIESIVPKTVRILYKNYRGETSWRNIIPGDLWWGSTTYHPQMQWLLTAQDMDKGVERHFAFKDIQKWEVVLPPNEPELKTNEDNNREEDLYTSNTELG